MTFRSIPQLYRHLGRWGEILGILTKYGLADWIGRLGPEFAKDLIRSRQGGAIARQPWETRVRLALCELGPTFIKLGQALSIRPDVVGFRLAKEFEHLQTDVVSDPPEVVRKTLEEELGRSVDQFFRHFDWQPYASASIAQVHRAETLDGATVAVKIQHPDIHRKVEVDLEILGGLVHLVEGLPEIRYFRPRALLAEFERLMRRELDFTWEQRHMVQFARNFAENPSVRIPRVYPELCTTRVLTMELVEGVPLSSREQLLAQGYDLTDLARRGAELYLEMIFIHGLYHADPHPGNLVILPGGVIGLLDYGLVGRLDEQLRADMEQLLLAVTGLDAEYLATVIMRIGSAPKKLDRTALVGDLADYVAHYGYQPLAAFDLAGALRELTEMVRRYRILLPPQLALLIKVLVTMEGTARLLAPQFNLLEVMRPYRRQMLWRRWTVGYQWRHIQRILGRWERLLEAIPGATEEVLGQLQEGRFRVRLEQPQLSAALNRLSLGILASGLIIGSCLLVGFKFPPVIHLGGHELSIPGLIGLGLGGFLAAKVRRDVGKKPEIEREEE